jgi:hypothetical protein
LSFSFKRGISKTNLIDPTDKLSRVIPSKSTQTHLVRLFQKRGIKINFDTILRRRTPTKGNGRVRERLRCTWEPLVRGTGGKLNFRYRDMGRPVR